MHVEYLAPFKNGTMMEQYTVSMHNITQTHHMYIDPPSKQLTLLYQVIY